MTFSHKNNNELRRKLHIKYKGKLMDYFAYSSTELGANLQMFLHLLSDVQ